MTLQTDVRKDGQMPDRRTDGGYHNIPAFSSKSAVINISLLSAEFAHSLISAITEVLCLIDPGVFIVSSPEHEVLSVSCCDGSMSIMHRPSSDIKNLL